MFDAFIFDASECTLHARAIAGAQKLQRLQAPTAAASVPRWLRAPAAVRASMSPLIVPLILDARANLQLASRVYSYQRRAWNMRTRARRYVRLATACACNVHAVFSAGWFMQLACELACLNLGGPCFRRVARIGYA
jgi:hypothetical protein